MTNKRLLYVLVGFPIFMLCLSFAFVPLYNVFCKATGYGGAVKRVERLYEQQVGQRDIKVRFNADVQKGLDIHFTTQERPVTVKPGKNALIFFTVENRTDEPIDAIAVYNVTPYKAAKYFNKIACFCFERQVLPPHKKIVMPVSFFIDSEVEGDREMDDIRTFTLSYTFYTYAEYRGSWLK